MNAPSAMPSRPGRSDRSSGGLRTAGQAALGIGIVFLLAVVIVDPFREFMTQDDGWAYARSVEHLLRTGEYRLDTWSAANMPVQIYLAAGLSQLFGYSLGLLRLPTLLLLAAGLAAFFMLLRETGSSVTHAALLSLGLLASPLVLLLGFTFMSDIQFMGWMLIALWLYTRGFQRGSTSSILLGAMAAACAIGTRQFGLAIVGGLVIGWLASSGAQRPRIGHLVLAAALPACVGLLQLVAGYSTPNFTQAVRLHEQAYYLSRPLPLLAEEVAWRTSTMLQYLGLLALPLLPALAALSWRASAAGFAAGAGGHAKDRLRLLLFALATAGMAVSTWRSSTLTAREPGSRVLALWWMLPNAFYDSRSFMLLLAAGGFLIACLLIWLVSQMRWAGNGNGTSNGNGNGERRFAPWFIAATGGCLYVMHLSYVQLNDTYLVGLMPFLLYFLASPFKRYPVPNGTIHAAMAGSVIALLALSLWMRGEYNAEQAQWAAADKILAQGVPAACIGGSKHWSEYNGAFDDWVQATYPSFDHKRGRVSPARPGPFHEPFYAWLAHRATRGRYLVKSAPGPGGPDGWPAVAEISYRDALFRKQTLQTLMRSDHGEAPCR